MLYLHMEFELKFLLVFALSINWFIKMQINNMQLGKKKPTTLVKICIVMCVSVCVS